ncbi:MAG: Maf family protein [Bryobacteraceae bacterium]
MIVLASASPRRAEILRAAGIDFIVQAANVPEDVAPGEDAGAYVRRVAAAKARAVDGGGLIVVAADTTVVVDGEIMGKPEDRHDAARMLRLLAGRWHEVITGVCIRAPLAAGAEREIVDAAVTRVLFGPMTAAEIDAYAGTGEPLDKAGAYAIQGLASRHVERIEGCYFNVVGLPVSMVWRRLRALGYQSTTEPSSGS